MKKLALFILSFALALSSSQVSANEGYVFEGDSRSERLYVLAATVRSFGEHGRGKNFQKLHPDRRSFYFSLEKCKGENCSEAQKLFLESAHRFADQYNQVLDDNGLSDDLKITILNRPQEGAFPIYLTNGHRLRKFRFDCPVVPAGIFSLPADPHTSDQCSVLMEITENVDKRVHSFLLDFTDLGFTEQKRYSHCISSGLQSTSKDVEFCQIEKKAIVFVHRYLEHGMSEDEVIEIVSKHWDDFEINS